MKIVDKIIEVVLALLPFLRRKDTRELKEFGEMVMGQYGFLVEQLDKALKDYFGLSDRVRELHGEVIALRKQLAVALPAGCMVAECKQRKALVGG